MLSVSGCIILVFSFVNLVVQRTHFLNVLLSLETATLGLFIYLYGESILWGSGVSSLVFITFGTCEAALGLSILVGLIRIRGNDFIQGFSSLKC